MDELKVTELANSRARIQTQVVWPENPCYAAPAALICLQWINTGLVFMTSFTQFPFSETWSLLSISLLPTPRPSRLTELLLLGIVSSRRPRFPPSQARRVAPSMFLHLSAHSSVHGHVLYSNLWVPGLCHLTVSSLNCLADVKMLNKDLSTE